MERTVVDHQQEVKQLVCCSNHAHRNILLDKVMNNEFGVVFIETGQQSFVKVGFGRQELLLQLRGCGACLTSNVGSTNFNRFMRQYLISKVSD